ncbi:MAG TPA: type IV pili twitching motility protein PilT, partial [Woeseiaceae bacterium]|nr:type IV pili twitching motility protein PilT [Woeseiaceae bacterium]
LIRQGRLDQLETAMQSGGSIGMQTMDSALMDLVERRFVSGKEAYQQAHNKAKFQQAKDQT